MAKAKTSRKSRKSGTAKRRAHGVAPHKGARGKCPNCGRWHDRSAHWSHRVNHGEKWYEAARGRKSAKKASKRKTRKSGKRHAGMHHVKGHNVRTHHVRAHEAHDPHAHKKTARKSGHKNARSAAQIAATKRMLAARRRS